MSKRKSSRNVKQLSPGEKAFIELALAMQEEGIDIDQDVGLQSLCNFVDTPEGKMMTGEELEEIAGLSFDKRKSNPTGITNEDWCRWLSCARMFAEGVPNASIRLAALVEKIKGCGEDVKKHMIVASGMRSSESLSDYVERARRSIADTRRLLDEMTLCVDQIGRGEVARVKLDELEKRKNLTEEAQSCLS